MVGINNNGKSIGVSTGTSIRDIYVPSFCGESSPVNLTLPGAPSKSVLYQLPVSCGFEHQPSYNYPTEKARALDFVYNPVIINNIALYRSGSSNPMVFSVEDLKKWGPAYHPEDREFEEWKRAGERDMAVSYFKPETTKVEIIEFMERPAVFVNGTPLDKPVRGVFYKGPIQKFGETLHRNSNFEQDVRNFLFSDYRTRFNPRTEDFIGFLNNEYETEPKQIVGIGSKDLGPNFAAELERYKHHSILTANTKLNSMARDVAERLGLGSKGKEYIKMNTIFHELAHDFQPDYLIRDPIKREVDVGERLHKYFSMKAEQLEGTEEGEIYKVLSEINSVYAESYKREGRIFSKLDIKSKKTKKAEENDLEKEISEENTKEVASNLEKIVKAHKGKAQAADGYEEENVYAIGSYNKEDVESNEEAEREEAYDEAVNE